MRISYNTDLGNLNTNVGYGVAGYNIIKSLQSLGHQVPFADSTAPVEIFFCQPEYWWFSGEENNNPDQYKIGYVPWESTEIPDMWWPGLKAVDEVWTTSQWCKEAFEAAGVPGPVKVFEHGLDPIWKPVRRNVINKFKFLHIGEPAPRKGGSLTVRAFMELFEGNDQVELTLKAHSACWARYEKNGRNVPLSSIKNINIIEGNEPEEQLLAYYMGHHALVYPSWGEGFGFIPLQALGTGMPTICTEAWAPYKQFLSPLGVDSTLVDSPWDNMHPGKMHEPSLEDLKEKMWLAYTDYKKLQEKFYNQAEFVHKHYNWERLTEEAFEPIVKKFS